MAIIYAQGEAVVVPVQALIIRDYPLLWVLSVGFELMELTFQHMLPNFNECWWDSWVLDVAVCNLLGARHHLGPCSPVSGLAHLYGP